MLSKLYNEIGGRKSPGNRFCKIFLKKGVSSWKREKEGEKKEIKFVQKVLKYCIFVTGSTMLRGKMGIEKYREERA
ncbi:hypothetical protein [Pseudoflavonifractor sp. AF19-9AC]|uniref:hypothetical protein n=1 Tax=Pseudoflavonifractor sp. AF19-9AC TaxID=2292244 RepID=UPI0011C3BD88|nr:hypothetical protein [Pseudoflavonifractor sp. AF19-9AC]